MADESEGLLSQDDINAALAAAGLEGEKGAPLVPGSGSAAQPLSGQDAVDAVLAEAGAGAAAAPEAGVDSAGRPFDEVAAAMAAAVEQEAAEPRAPGSPAPPPAGASRMDVPELAGPGGAPGGARGIDLLRDVELNVKIELGRSRMLVDEVLRLGEGSVVELDKLAGDPVDVFVNDRLVARGEVLVLNDNFCVRISDIVSSEVES